MFRYKTTHKSKADFMKILLNFSLNRRCGDIWEIYLQTYACSEVRGIWRYLGGKDLNRLIGPSETALCCYQAK